MVLIDWYVGWQHRHPVYHCTLVCTCTGNGQCSTQRYKDTTPWKSSVNLQQMAESLTITPMTQFLQQRCGRWLRVNQREHVFFLFLVMYAKVKLVLQMCMLYNLYIMLLVLNHKYKVIFLTNDDCKSKTYINGMMMMHVWMDGQSPTTAPTW